MSSEGEKLLCKVKYDDMLNTRHKRGLFPEMIAQYQVQGIKYKSQNSCGNQHFIDNNCGCVYAEVNTLNIQIICLSVGFTVQELTKPIQFTIAMNSEQKVFHSGSLKLFEKEKSRHVWTKYWAILGSNSLRLFTNHESFLNASEEPKLILITADSFCKSVNKNDQTFQFKITNGETFVLKCETELARKVWLDNLEMVLTGFCRNTCFHCNHDEAQVGINVDNNRDASRQSFTENFYNQPGEIVSQNTFNSTSTNNPKHSAGSEGQITINSPLKIYETEQNIFKSFNKSEHARPVSEAGSVITNLRALKSSQSEPQMDRKLKNQKSPKNSFGYSFETDSADRVSTSSLQLFDASNKRLSTFSKRSLKRHSAMPDFANPGFISDDSNLQQDLPEIQQDLPEIPRIVSKDYGTPINHDVPALSKDDPSRGLLKVLTGNNKWKEYQVSVEKNILILSDPENHFLGQNATRIELKPNIKFTILPRRSNDYRFKMTSGTTEYFFKTPSVNRRQSWIKTLTAAASSVCQMTCPLCCTKAKRNITDHDDSQSVTSEVSLVQSEEDTDDVFYVGMTNPSEGSEGTTFANNTLAQESVNELYCASDQQPIDSGELESVESPCFRSGYLKTNAIDENWGQFWATITGKQLILHACEDNPNALKIIELTRNVQCKTAKRSSYDFRFTLVASPVEFYEFKCISANDRRGWMTALEKVAGGLGKTNSGSRISEIVTKIRENESRLQEVQRQQQEEAMKRQQEKNLDGGQDIYDDILQEQQQSQPNIDEIQGFYEALPAEEGPHKHILPPTFVLPPPKPPKKTEKPTVSIVVGQDIYDDTTQQGLPVPPQQPPPATPPRKQHSLLQELPPPPQQLPPLTPPQLRRKQQEQQRVNAEESKKMHDGFVENANTVQPLPTASQLSEQQQRQITSADVGGEELYELIPGENSQQEGAENEELYEVLPGEATEQQSREEQQKTTEKQVNKPADKKGKNIFSVLHKKQKEKKKKEPKDKRESEQTQNKQDKENQTQQQQQRHQEAETLPESLELNVDASNMMDVENVTKEMSEDALNETNETTWNFEEHVQVLQEAAQPLQVSAENDVEITEDEKCAADDEITNENRAEDETAVAGITQDVERFLTQVLGKVNNLPGDVNKERLELTEKLQKFLKLPDKDASKRKPPPPLPSKPSPADDNQVDEGEYGDVAAHDVGGEEMYDDVVKGDVGGEEMYDDVAQMAPAGPPEDIEEEYDDVAALTKTETNDEPEEFYDDIDPGINTGIANRSSSKKSNNSEILDATGVTEPRRASDITDKIYEGDLEKYKSKGLFKKFQRRYCVLTPLALYYYENKKDQKQKGQIILPSSESTLRKGCHNFPEVKDKKLCFELLNESRCYLFKVTKESELDIWITHIRAALSTDLSDEQCRIMRQNSVKMSVHDDDDVEEGEDLYECIDTMQQNKPSADSEETSGSSGIAPILPARVPAAAGKATTPAQDDEEEEFEKVDDEMEDYETDSSAPTPGGKSKDEEKPPPVVNRAKPSSSPTLPPRPTSSQDVPHLPPRATPGAKKGPPTLPTRTTPTLTKKSQPSPPESEPEPEPEPKTEPAPPKPEVLPPVKTKPLKPGEQFDYNKVYVAMWNCAADDDDDLAFSRGNYLYIREKIPNSDWWVASLMDIPDIRVGLVPRNYIMPAYEM